jgi:hypothetical protein
MAVFLIDQETKKRAAAARVISRHKEKKNRTNERHTHTHIIEKEQIYLKVHFYILNCQQYLTI